MQNEAARQSEDLRTSRHTQSDETLSGSSDKTLTQSPAQLMGNPGLHGRGNGAVRAASILQMQQTHGNRAVQRFIQRTPDRSMPVQREPDEEHIRRQAQAMAAHDVLGPSHFNVPPPEALAPANPIVAPPHFQLSAGAATPHSVHITPTRDNPTGVPDRSLRPLVDHLPASDDAASATGDSHDASGGEGDDSTTGVGSGGATVRLGPHATGIVTTGGISTAIREHGLDVGAGGDYNGTLRASVGQSAHPATANRLARQVWNVAAAFNPLQGTASVDASAGQWRASASGAVSRQGRGAEVNVGWGYRPDPNPDTPTSPPDAIQAAGQAPHGNTTSTPADPQQETANQSVTAAIRSAMGGQGVAAAGGQAAHHGPVNPHPHDGTQHSQDHNSEGPPVGVQVGGGVGPQTGSHAGGTFYWRLP